MDSRTESALRDVLTAEMSFYQRAQAIVRLVTPENIADVMAKLPRDFYAEFMHHADEVYAPTAGPRVLIGRRLPDISLAAIRAYLHAQNTETKVERVDAMPRSVRNTHPPRVVEVIATGWMAS